MNESPLVSVVVPIYGVEKYIEKCIQSIVGQSYRNLEIILVDDGSKDRCGMICDQYATVDNRIKVIHKKNGGLVSARKCGVVNSTGKYIQFVDGDDWIAENMISKMVNEAEKNGVDIIMCNYFEAGEKCVQHNLIIEPGVYEGSELENIINNNSLFGNTYKSGYSFGIEPVVWNKMFCREIIKKVELEIPNEISYGEDVACTFPAIMLAKKILVISEPLYYYRYNPNSMSKAYSSVQTTNCIDLIRYLEAKFEKSDGLLRQLDYYKTTIIVANINNEAKLGIKFDLLKRFELIKKYIRETKYVDTIDRIDRNLLNPRTLLILNSIKFHFLFPLFWGIALKYTVAKK